VRVAEDGVALPPDAGPCFRAPTPGEIVAEGRKLVGSAQVRLGEAILQHGSVILEGDQSALVRLGGNAHDLGAPATLRSLAGPLLWLDAARAVADGLCLALPGAWTQAAYTPAETEAGERLEHERYGCDAWTWRR
jgi:lipoate-protein ligase A